MSSAAYGKALVNTSPTRRYPDTRYNLSDPISYVIYIYHICPRTQPSPTACNSLFPNFSCVIWLSSWFYFSLVRFLITRLRRQARESVHVLTYPDDECLHSSLVACLDVFEDAYDDLDRLFLFLFFFFLLLTFFCFFGVSNSVMKRNDMTKRTFYLTSLLSTPVEFGGKIYDLLALAIDDDGTLIYYKFFGRSPIRASCWFPWASRHAYVV